MYGIHARGVSGGTTHATNSCDRLGSTRSCRRRHPFPRCGAVATRRRPGSAHRNLAAERREIAICAGARTDQRNPHLHARTERRRGHHSAALSGWPVGADRVHLRVRPRVSGDGHGRVRSHPVEAAGLAHGGGRPVARRPRLRHRAAGHRPGRQDHDDHVADGKRLEL